MPPIDSEHYLNSSEVQLSRYKKRKYRRLIISVSNIEPGSKNSMLNESKDEIQRQILQMLKDTKRRAFRGPIALCLTLNTSANNPPHIHTIAKNLLDLFSKPRDSISTNRSGLFYQDDSQIHALSVKCLHGMDRPQISVIAFPLRDILLDIEIADEYTKQKWEIEDNWVSETNFNNVVGDLDEVERNESQYRKLLGDMGFQMQLHILKQSAQQILFEREQLSPSKLSYLYNITNLASDISESLDRLFHLSPLRIKLSELPQSSGDSDCWKNEIGKKLKSFKNNYGGLVNPLKIPIALEVVVKPPSPSRQKNITDLDNILRSYLIPKVIEILEPVTNLYFAFDRVELLLDEPEAQKNTNSLPQAKATKTPPASTRTGVMRYEVWRLPPADEKSEGFVSMSVVADTTGFGGVFEQIEAATKKWEESLDHM